jgi:hypothetical protein
MRHKALILALNYVLSGLLCFQIVYGTIFHALTPALLYTFLGGLLAGAVAVSIISAAKPGQPAWLIGDFRTFPEGPFILLLAGYVFAFLSVENMLAGISSSACATLAPVLLAVAFTVALFVILKLYEGSVEAKGISFRSRNHFRPSTIWMLLMVFFAVPIVTGFALAFEKVASAGNEPAWFARPIQLSILWTAFASVFFGATLLRPSTLVRSRIGLWFSLGALIFAGVSLALEEISRKNWYFWAVSLLTFFGVTLGLVGIWVRLFSKRNEAASSHCTGGLTT